MTKAKAISRRQFFRAAGTTAVGAVMASCNLPTGVVNTPVTTPSTTSTPSPAPNQPIVDMRPVIKNLGLAVRQQTDLAPCAVHAITFLLEYVSIRRIFSDLSEAYLQYMTFQVEKPPMKGGENFKALNVGYQKWGILPQRLASNEVQSTTILPSQWDPEGERGCRLTQVRIKEWDSSSGATPEQLNKALACLDADLPVAVGVLWPKKYQTKALDGIDAMVVPSAADKWDVVFDGHAVALVGYGKGQNFPGGGYFIFRNSWGTTFGDQGYGYMPFDYVQKYANDLCIFDSVFAAPPAGSGAN